MTIKEITDLLKAPVSAEVLAELKADDRKGVQKLLAAYEKRMVQLAEKKAGFEKRMQLERKYWAEGKVVAGIDEVGRGPLAGPLVVCAAILKHDFNLLDVNDSKQVSRSKRELLYDQILEQVVDYKIIVKSSQDVDKYNPLEADRMAMKEAAETLSVRPDILLVDAVKVNTDIPQVDMNKGDSISNSIAAASILAKVYRDNLMKEYAKQYPEYGFEKNAGYGTADHLAALKKYGPTPIHRLSYDPVKKSLKN
ncbi:MAG: ribonuclease HII [Lactobacillus sp.]|nr:ribonuclease HII [Lactobacillus sp.]